MIDKKYTAKDLIGKKCRPIRNLKNKRRQWYKSGYRLHDSERCAWTRV